MELKLIVKDPSLNLRQSFATLLTLILKIVFLDQ